MCAYINLNTYNLAHIIGNRASEIDFLLKSAKAFVKADKSVKKLQMRSNKNEYLEGALKSYNQALLRLEDDSVLKAAVIREIKKINPTYEGTSSFSSPCHRIYDLEQSAADCITNKDYVAALERLTDIFDNITERKKESLYWHVLNRIEISRLLLFLILDLPPSRQSPSHIKLLEKYSNVDINEFCAESKGEFHIPTTIQASLRNLVISWQDKDNNSLLLSVEELSGYFSLTKQHRQLLCELMNIYKS